MATKLLFTIVLLLIAGTLIWASDQITLQGQRTIYTVDCVNGSWDAKRCTGQLVAGNRYRFRASKARQEVVFWVAGSNEPSGKYADCTVKDRGNWSCTVAEGQPASITNEMANNSPTRKDAGTATPVRAVPKWKWWVLRTGLPVFKEVAF